MCGLPAPLDPTRYRGTRARGPCGPSPRLFRKILGLRELPLVALAGWDRPGAEGSRAGRRLRYQRLLTLPLPTRVCYQRGMEKPKCEGCRQRHWVGDPCIGKNGEPVIEAAPKVVVHKPVVATGAKPIKGGKTRWRTWVERHREEYRAKQREVMRRRRAEGRA